jgi:hypothetical protein
MKAGWPDPLPTPTLQSYFIMVPDKWHGLSVIKPMKLPILKSLPSKNNTRGAASHKGDNQSMEQLANANQPVYA